MLTNQNENLSVTYTLAGNPDAAVADSLAATTSDASLTATVVDASTVNVRSADAVATGVIVDVTATFGTTEITGSITLDVAARAPDAMVLTESAPVDN